jgi:hypothetical protein
MIANKIRRRHVIRAIEGLARSGWPKRNRSTKYDLIYRGDGYPPKQVIREAADVAGVDLDPSFGGGRESNTFLQTRGFVVVGKRGVLLAVKPSEEDAELSFAEGALVFRRHRIRERSGSAPRIAKEQRLAKTGDLRCDVCDFSFVEYFGERGAGFIEAHHDRPLSIAAGRVGRDTSRRPRARVL